MVIWDIIRHFRFDPFHVLYGQIISGDANEQLFDDVHCRAMAVHCFCE